MNSLHICAHYDEGKLLSVAWLPVGQSTMSTFTWVFWLAAAVFCQLDTSCVCVFVCMCALIQLQTTQIPVLFTPQAHAAGALAIVLTVFMHKHTLSSHSH